MKFKSKEGFSLIELMVVVAIIGILSAVGVPKYQVFKAKAVRAEADSGLTQLYTIQQANFMDTDQYSSVIGGTGLKFDVPANAKYTYTTTGGNTFVAKAVLSKNTNKLASCSTAAGDNRQIDQDKLLKVPSGAVDGLAGC